MEGEEDVQAMVSFSYHLTLGNMDEAFKASKLIKRLFVCLVDWLVGCSFGYLFVWLVVCLFGWLLSCLFIYIISYKLVEIENFFIKFQRTLIY